MNLTTVDNGQIFQQLQDIVVPPAPVLPNKRDVEALDRFTRQYAAA